MMLLQELSQLVGGTLTSQADLKITGAASIARATPTEITFATSEKHLQQFLKSDAAAAVIPLALQEVCQANPDVAKPCLVVDRVDDAFAKIVAQFKTADRA